MSLENLILYLQTSRKSATIADFPSAPGVYAIFLKRQELLQGIVTQDGGLLYVGSSSNLHEREINDHFGNNNTGFSTLRRSIGAILKDQLGLTPIPRGKGNSPKDFANYRFDAISESKLTKWMTLNLDVSVKAVPQDFESIEQSLIAAMEPPLCLKHWENPQRAMIKLQRKRCSDEAKSNRNLV